MPALAPKAHLEGFTLPAGLKLPTIKSTRKDAAFVPTLLANNGVKNANVGMLNPKAHEKSERLPGPLIYNTMVPNFFKCSYFTRVEDIPDDLLETAIWALGMFARAWDEATEQDLRAIGHLIPGNRHETAKYLALSNTRRKFARHLLYVHNYKINRSADAIPYLRAMVENEKSRIPKAWLINPILWGMYGEALARDGSDDKEVQKMLELALQAPGTQLPVDIAVCVRVFLARVLPRLSLDTRPVEHENWVIKWFRKSPTLMEDTAMRNLLMPEEDYNDAILEQLEGEEWLASRKTTFKADNNATKICRQCETRSIQKPLLKDSRCKHIYYCVRIGQLIRKAAKTFNDKALIHALGLHRDPNRSRIYIVFKRTKYAPEASKDFRYKFHIDEMGVYKISDVMPEIESILRLRPGEGREHMDGLFEDVRRIETAQK
ncbi:hypothetical protein M422DRAFT_263060 [Sphaerobolus stellatus SS14]|uniref:Uncharacterized protein n=1 Tax=Sphaerobolus stellatus (strain SS14) TaxID=990650 RepID=A0A0C9UZX5_SPHS4|nr:hypothetical protein M422DRAFT_263060 [Sphaerobolus stellatus SS14]